MSTSIQAFNTLCMKYITSISQRGHALPALIDDRASLRSRRILPNLFSRLCYTSFHRTQPACKKYYYCPQIHTPTKMLPILGDDTNSPPPPLINSKINILLPITGETIDRQHPNSRGIPHSCEQLARRLPFTTSLTVAARHVGGGGTH